MALPDFESVTTWEDSRAYTLSDRIWNLGEGAAATIDALVANNLARNNGDVTALATALEHYIRPDRQPLFINSPYGGRISFEAMRLAVSEITRANGLAAKIGAMLNPLVRRVYYHLSPLHKDRPGDPCEDYAAESEANDGYPPADVPLPMEDTHALCLCYLTYGLYDDYEARLGNWISMYESDPDSQPPISPLAIILLLLLLLGFVILDEDEEVKPVVDDDLIDEFDEIN